MNQLKTGQRLWLKKLAILKNINFFSFYTLVWNGFLQGWFYFVLTLSIFLLNSSVLQNNYFKIMNNHVKSLCAMCKTKSFGEIISSILYLLQSLLTIKFSWFAQINGYLHFFSFLYFWVALLEKLEWLILQTTMVESYQKTIHG